MLKALRPDDGGPLSEHSITMFIKTIIVPAEVIVRHMLLLMAAQLAPHARKPTAPNAAPSCAGGDRAQPKTTPSRPQTPHASLPPVRPCTPRPDNSAYG